MMRRVGFVCLILFFFAAVHGQSSLPAEWSGTYQTVAGETGPLTCTISAPAADSYKAVLVAVQYGIQFELTGKKEADKFVFGGTASTDVGPFEFKGEVVDLKFTGNFKSQAYNGTFQLAPVQPMVGDWSGSFRTASGDSGDLTAQITAGSGDDLKAVITVTSPGLQFELPGKKEADKAVFAASVTPSAELGTIEVKGELANGKFAGTFTGQTVSGTFELAPVRK